MPRGGGCSACNHNQAPAITRDIVLGGTLRVVAKKYALTKDIIARHKTKCIDEGTKRKILLQRKRVEEQEIATELNSERVEVSGGLRRCVKEIELILERAKERGDDPLALASLKEMRGALIDLAKLHGQLKTELVVTVDLTASHEWSQLREILVEVFSDFPEAEKAFVAKVRHLGVVDGGTRKLIS